MQSFEVSLGIPELIVEWQKPGDIYVIKCLKCIRQDTIESWCFFLLTLWWFLSHPMGLDDLAIPSHIFA